MSRVTSDTDSSNGSKIVPVMAHRAEGNKSADRSIHHSDTFDRHRFAEGGIQVMRTAQNTVGPDATSNRRGIPVRNFSIASSF